MRLGATLSAAGADSSPAAIWSRIAWSLAAICESVSVNGAIEVDMISPWYRRPVIRTTTH